MKILFLTHVFPFPLNDGMRSTCYALIRELSRKNETALLSLIEFDEEKRYLPEIEKWCKRVEVVKHSVPRSPWLRLRNIFLEFQPFCITQFYSPEFSAKLQEMVQKEHYDIVQFLSVNISGYLAEIGETAGIFFPHDSLSMQFHRTAKLESNLLRKFYFFSQAKKMKRYEKEAVKKFAKTVVVSDVDKNWILKDSPEANIDVIPAGVDLDRFQPQTVTDNSDGASSSCSVLFRGAMNFFPNWDAALYFHSKIMPLVLKKVPDLSYIIIGKEPPEAIRCLHDGKHVFVLGLVEDLRPHMAKATVHICPLRAGSGIKNKILEAWAMEKPVVATSIACDGIQLEPDKQLLVADTAESFAESVIRLIQDPELRKNLGKNGREWVIQKYSWAHSASLFQKIYQELSESTHPELIKG